MSNQENLGPIPKLEIVDMHFSYNNQHEILSNLSLDVQDREFVSVIGDSGAGKTTLYSLITRLYNNISGSIKI